MTLVKKLQWFLYGVLMVLYCISFYMMHQRYDIYNKVVQQQQDLVPGQWIQKQKCWPGTCCGDGYARKLNEKFEFYGEKLKLISVMNMGVDEYMKRGPEVGTECVTYWERLQ